MAVADASTMSASGAPGIGCTSRVAFDKSDLHFSNALVVAGVQWIGDLSFFLFPFRNT